jgi:pyruvate/2-oxoglutarate dehydrogenase complex dihydrolipoamide dehydrogenase (E3) component
MDRYDIFVIGGGGTGSECAFRLGETRRFRIGMAERDKLGGECTNRGCVPTKTMLRAAKAVHSARKAEVFGIRVRDVEVDFPKVMERVNAIVAEMLKYGTKPFEDLGIDVFMGAEARFTAPHELSAGAKSIRADNVIVATGTKATAPEIPGLAEAGFWTNAEAVAAKSLPSSLAIVGAGPIGVEFAQIYSRLGSKVTLIEALPRILAPEDADSSAAIAEVLDEEGIRMITSARIDRVSREGSSRRIHFEGGEVVDADELLVAAGRVPDFDALGVAAAGIELDKNGKPVLDAQLRTNVGGVWAAGDATGDLLFTHVGGYEAQLVSDQIANGSTRKADYRVVPKVTYCEPEVASAGLTEAQAVEEGFDVRVGRADFADNERALIEGETRGLVKVVADNATGEILGGHIVGAGAGEMIHEVVAAMAGHVKVRDLADAIHAYPTLSESLRSAFYQIAG